MNLDLRSSVRSTPWDEPISVPPDMTVRQVSVLLHRHRIGAVVVRATGDGDVGMVSERDIVALVATGGDLDARAGDIATAGMVTVDVAASMADVADAMVVHQVRHVGVTDGDEVVGVLSARDLAAAAGARATGRSRAPDAATFRLVITAFVFVETSSPADVVPLGTAIASIEGVYECFSVTGTYDLIAMLRVKTHEDIAHVVTERIAALGGIRSTTTTIAFRAYGQQDLTGF